MNYPIQKIISGGQTGVDRAALDAAIELGIPHGGYCPAGRRAEDGVISDRYVLTETKSAEYNERTEQNVLASDGTLLIYRSKLTGGTLFTHDLCALHEKPAFLIDLTEQQDVRTAFLDWLVTSKIRILNVAGSRESVAPGIYAQAKSLLIDLLHSGPKNP